MPDFDLSAPLPAALQLARYCAWRPLMATPTLPVLDTPLTADNQQQHWQVLCDHRLWGLAYDALQHDTQQAEAWLGGHWPTLVTRQQQVRLQVLKLATVQQRLQRAFTEAGIALRVLKGPGLGHKLYADATARHSKDLDLLVAPAELWHAAELLQAQGFVLEHLPPLTAANRQLITRQFWHLELTHPSLQVHLELHWRLEPVQQTPREAQWPATFAGEQVDAAELLYLLFHGARHQWFRLKWLGDVLAITERWPQRLQEMETLAERLQLQDVVAQAALLLSWLWPEIARVPCAAWVTHASPRARQMAALAQGYLLRHDHPELANRMSWGARWRMHRYQSWLNRRHPRVVRLRQLYNQLCYASCDISQLQLPDHQHWQYPLRRLPRMLQRWWRARHNLAAVRHG